MPAGNFADSWKTGIGRLSTGVRRARGAVNRTRAGASHFGPADGRADCLSGVAIAERPTQSIAGESSNDRTGTPPQPENGLLQPMPAQRWRFQARVEAEDTVGEVGLESEFPAIRREQTPRPPTTAGPDELGSR